MIKIILFIIITELLSKLMENGISGQLRTVISLVDKLRDINL